MSVVSSGVSTACFLLGGVGFIVGLKMLSKPSLARRGNAISAVGMGLATLGAVVRVFGEMETGLGSAVLWIALGVGAGAAVGAPLARLVKMTAMPEMVALLNGFGGLASALVAWSEVVGSGVVGSGVAGSEVVGSGGGELIGGFEAATLSLAALIGGVTFTGSLVAYGKLSERIPSKAMKLPGQTAINGAVLAAALGLTVVYAADPGQVWAFVAVLGLGTVWLGAGLVLPIGGADMPVVISLLNSYSGLAVCAAGFAIGQPILVVTGSLVGTSGLILTRIMCMAMNRSLANVLFGGYKTGGTVSAAEGREAIVATPQEMYLRLESARSVVIVPGYGMAVAQAQHAVRELADLLEANGSEVVYAIHPVAGRMPGHMSVLLAEASVPYEKLVEMEDVNGRMETVDAAVVIGANDTVNPDARDNPGSALAGMPIIEVDRAASVFVLKRSLGAGYAGVENPLFFRANTSMVLGDAKKTLEAVVEAFKDEG